MSVYCEDPAQLVTPSAQLSIEVIEGLVGAPQPCGLISSYQAHNAKAGIALLQDATRLLLQRGAKGVVGPMSGSSWGSYRLTLPPLPGDEPADTPAFFGEPTTPLEYADHFVQAGFTLAATYQSRLYENIRFSNRRVLYVLDTFRQRGLIFRSLDLNHFHEELEHIYNLCCVAFANNPYYTPISLETFLHMHLPLAPLLDPELVRLCFLPSGRLVGLALAYPDTCGDPGRVVLKTLARSSGHIYGGLGLALAEEVHLIAHAKGYHAIIHALMHDNNVSLRLSLGYRSTVLRRYGLFSAGPYSVWNN